MPPASLPEAAEFARPGSRKALRRAAGTAALLVAALALALAAGCRLPRDASTEGLRLPRSSREPPLNIILILTDDHRWDHLGFAGHPFLETPNLDRLARDGVHARHAFVTTSLCSPSRASILTGLYAHNHGVADNYHRVPDHLIFFPQYLQAAGYETAFIGKWHMGGEIDDPQRGFDHWLAFKGQGTYWPDGRGATRVVPQTRYDGFNIDGRRVPQRGYITDELTDYALRWLEGRAGRRPFFLYLSHKAVHSDFVPADRHAGRYRDRPFSPTATLEGAQADPLKPMWLRNQRNSRHGVDFGYNLEDYDLESYAKRYAETLLAVDESLGRVLAFLEGRGLLERTLVVYMGDNGFHLGEHGLIDKRTAYEPSIRVPLLLHCPAALPRGAAMEQLVANIDLAPTLLEAAGLEPPPHLDGRSFWALARGEERPWRDALLYEYAWEWNYPYTPTIHAVRTERRKYIRYHGVWDIDELYDLEADPLESRNLILEPEHRAEAERLRARLFALLEESNGRSLPLLPDRGRQYYERRREAAQQAAFPPHFFEPFEPVRE
jgi:N-acetylglucosamine-6-sulfatase